VIPNLVDDGLSILQYADDTILFMDHNLDQARNIKLLLIAFEKMSGLKINFHKSKYSPLIRRKMRSNSMNNYLVVVSGLSPFDI
jgi:hypothetical protein